MNNTDITIRFLASFQVNKSCFFILLYRGHLTRIYIWTLEARRYNLALVHFILRQTRIYMYVALYMNQDNVLFSSVVHRPSTRISSGFCR